MSRRNAMRRNQFNISAALMLMSLVHGRPNSMHFQKLDHCRQMMYTPESNVVLSAEAGVSRIQCGTLCLRDRACASLTYQRRQQKCVLNCEVPSPDCRLMEAVNHSVTYEMVKTEKCSNNGFLEDGHCVCVNGYIGQNCEQLMQDCSDGFVTGFYDGLNGVYWMQPRDPPPRPSRDPNQHPPPTSPTQPFQSYCIMENGGLTMIQNNFMEGNDFYRLWEEYKQGFGDPHANFWLGLENIHKLISGLNPRRLGIEVYTCSDTDYSVKYQQFYDSFRVAHEGTNYRLDISAPTSMYREDDAADLGDSMSASNGMAFSTPDRDHDGSASRNCAGEHMAGWWFTGCGFSNPNGPIYYSLNGSRLNITGEAFWINNLQELAICEISMWIF